MSGEPDDGHQVALFKSLPSQQVAELETTLQEEPSNIFVKETHVGFPHTVKLELEVEDTSPQQEPGTGSPAAASVSITRKNVENIGKLLQRCREEGGILTELAEKAEPTIRRMLQKDEVLVCGREVEVLQQLGHAYMLALANQMDGAQSDNEAAELNWGIVWAGCVLDAFIPVVEWQERPLSDEEVRLLAAE